MTTNRNAEETLERAKVAVADAREAVFAQHNHTAGIDLAKHALTLCQEANWSVGIGKSYTYIGVCEKFAGNYSAALRSHAAAFEAYERGAVPLTLLASAKNNLAQVCLIQRDFIQAKQFYEEAIELAKKSGDANTIAAIYINLANMYHTTGDIEPGFHAAQKAMDAIEAGAADGSHTSIYFTLAQLYYSKGDIEAALAHMERVFDELRRFPDKKRECEAWNFKSAILVEVKPWEEGLLAAEHALMLAREMDSPWHEAQALKNSGLFIEKLGRTEEAMERYQLAAEQFHKLNAFDNEAMALIGIGELLISQGNETGISILVRSLECVEQSGAKREIALSHKALSSAYKQFGESSKALEHYERFHAIELERRSEDSERQLSVMKSHQQTEKESLRADQSERDLANTTLQLLAQTELLSDLRADLLQIARKIPATEPAARELRERVKRLPCESIDWEKFDTQFKAAHPDFVHMLMAAVPDLSPMEIRISTLIRMNLKSEEIARLFCVTERAVEFHRLNIRKKMGLKTKDNLSLVLAKM